mgnify:FL=1
MTSPSKVVSTVTFSQAQGAVVQPPPPSAMQRHASTSFGSMTSALATEVLAAGSANLRTHQPATPLLISPDVLFRHSNGQVGTAANDVRINLTNGGGNSGGAGNSGGGGAPCLHSPRLVPYHSHPPPPLGTTISPGLSPQRLSSGIAVPLPSLTMPLAAANRSPPLDRSQHPHPYDVTAAPVPPVGVVTLPSALGGDVAAEGPSLQSQSKRSHPQVARPQTPSNVPLHFQKGPTAVVGGMSSPVSSNVHMATTLDGGSSSQVEFPRTTTDALLDTVVVAGRSSSADAPEATSSRLQPSEVIFTAEPLDIDKFDAGQGTLAPGVALEHRLRQVLYSHQGRDKMFKVLQYALRLKLFFEGVRYTNTFVADADETQFTLTERNLMSLTNARRLFKVGRFWSEFIRMQTAIVRCSELMYVDYCNGAVLAFLQFQMVLDILARFMGTLKSVADDVAYAARKGFLHGNIEERANAFALRFVVPTIAIDFFLNLLRVAQCAVDLRQSMHSQSMEDALWVAEEQQRQQHVVETTTPPTYDGTTAPAALVPLAAPLANQLPDGEMSRRNLRADPTSPSTVPFAGTDVGVQEATDTAHDSARCLTASQPRSDERPFASGDTFGSSVPGSDGVVGVSSAAPVGVRNRHGSRRGPKAQPAVRRPAAGPQGPSAASSPAGGGPLHRSDRGGPSLSSGPGSATSLLPSVAVTGGSQSLHDPSPGLPISLLQEYEKHDRRRRSTRQFASAPPSSPSSGSRGNTPVSARSPTHVMGSAQHFATRGGANVEDGSSEVGTHSPHHLIPSSLTTAATSAVTPTTMTVDAGKAAVMPSWRDVYIRGWADAELRWVFITQIKLLLDLVVGCSVGLGWKGPRRQALVSLCGLLSGLLSVYRVWVYGR